VRRGVGVVAAGEVAVVRRHDRVLLALLHVLPESEKFVPRLAGAGVNVMILKIFSANLKHSSYS
jgi:hypothetical protein